MYAEKMSPVKILKLNMLLNQISLPPHIMLLEN